MSVTEQLATFVTNSRTTDIPPQIYAEAKRAIINYMGCAIGGANEPALDNALDVLLPFTGKATSHVLGRSETCDPLYASLFNGIGSHVHEYDDTIPKNYIHPSIPVASALFAYASANQGSDQAVTGEEFLQAFILGFDIESRIGNAVYPSHYEAGWHITSTTGVFGAAAAIGKLLKLDTKQMVWAFGLAATQAAGIREMFGSMAKSFQPGRAAQNGYTAALLAKNNFTAGEKALEGPRGFATITATEYDLDKAVDQLGEHYELLDNAYKPYACGLVVHPTIDACSQIREMHNIDPATVERIDLRVAPLVLDLCNHKDLKRALQSKYSIYHAAAIGLARGKGGLREFTDEAVADPVLSDLRSRTNAVADESITDDQADVTLTLKSGESIHFFLEASLGNMDRPLSNAQLDDKFIDQATLVLPQAQVDALLAATWEISSCEDVGSIVDLAVHKGD
ncbi:MAG: 2-methylcitrate dehydratase [SAR86 cluster bacterium]|uniref:2-methylcitrate dehydratase n=1 Tax=SAR86 cluster bacterium TaxID=2030880 RepID=A0A2A5C7P2_9GAMM|nr:MmgE/PrpD family protein [Gammaproteobacteria bacterium AH-315-E17]PCJ39773.1 MAG: 2-methylcitrate dehydratase [SAR86 cluster bacterium]